MTMDLLELFLKNHLQTSKKEMIFSKFIHIYSGDNKTFVIGLGTNGGVISEKKKDEIMKYFINIKCEIYFFTLFKNWEAFQKNIDLISWGTYVWVGTAPKHTIHFDDKPKLKACQLKYT